jgi:FkbM family methyltransferase
MAMLKKIKSIFRKKPHKKPEHTDFYNLPKSCQVPKLGYLYEKYFGKINNGVFVEIGAFDGEYASNTCCLADLGWKGFYVEPVPEYFEKCVVRHKKNINIKTHNLAIGPFEGKVRVNVAGPLSTIDLETKKVFETLDWAKNKVTGRFVESKQVTLDGHLKSNGVEKGFDLLVIDVEGYEWEVLRAFDITFWAPKMVIIELHDQNPNYPHLADKCSNMVKYFEDAQYRIIYKDFTNTVYIRKELNAFRQRLT